MTRGSLLAATHLFFTFLLDTLALRFSVCTPSSRLMMVCAVLAFTPSFFSNSAKSDVSDLHCTLLYTMDRGLGDCK